MPVLQSHSYEFKPRTLIAQLLLTFAPLAVFALAVRLGAAFDLLPSPKPIVDVDRTILCHQAEASRTQQTADLLLVGDSSCLMDIDASQLQLPGGRQALNLGTLSYLTLTDHAALIRHFSEANPGQLKTVVLLMHPETLRISATSDFHRNTLYAYYAERDLPNPNAPFITREMGAGIFRDRLLSRALPTALPGAYGQMYGFNFNLWDYLSEHRGSAVDPRQFTEAMAQRDIEWGIPTRAEAGAKSFRRHLPAGVKLIAGLTPLPEAFAGSHLERTRHSMLSQWAAWVGADAVLLQLPTTLPNSEFASPTHLNARGQQRYTIELSRALRPYLE